MKKQVLYGATLVMILAACSNNETEGISPDQPKNAVPIRIGQTVEGMTARAAVENGSKVTATVLTVNYSSSYDAATVWNNFTAQSSNVVNEGNNTLTTPANISTATFTAGTNEAVALQPVLYYYADNGTALVAVAPDGNLSGSKIEMKLQDGEQDVMYADKQVDTKPDSQKAADNSPVALTFAHKTTQLNFAFQLSKAPTSSWKDQSVSVKSISIQNASVPVSVNYANGTVNFKKPGTSLEVPGIVAGNNIGTTALKIGRPVMVDASSDIKLDVTLTVGSKDYTFSNVPIMKNGGTNGEKLQTAIGSSHLITLTVTEPVKPSDGVEITTQATVTQWAPGQAGSGELK